MADWYYQQDSVEWQLWKAVDNRNLAEARSALARGAPPNIRHEGHSVLSRACLFGDESIVRLLLEAGAKLDSGCIHEAAGGRSANPRLVKLLLDIGANVDDRSGGHELGQMKTPLWRAIDYRNYEVAMVLLTHGADPNGWAGYDATPLAVAAQNGDENSVRLLLEHGADATGPRGMHALYCAMRGGYLEIVRALLEHGADMNAVNPANGGTPLDHADLWERADIVHFLEQRGATRAHKVYFDD